MEKVSIEDVIKSVLQAMAVSFDTVERLEAGVADQHKFLIRTKESSLLIGSNGEHLDAFNHLIRRLVTKKAGEDSIKLFVDVNGYQERAVELIKAKAKMMSDRARSFKTDIELDPMTSYERMLIHSFLEGIPDIKTESVGEGHKRRIVIKYIK